MKTVEYFTRYSFKIYFIMEIDKVINLSICGFVKLLKTSSLIFAFYLPLTARQQYFSSEHSTIYQIFYYCNGNYWHCAIHIC